MSDALSGLGTALVPYAWATHTLFALALQIVVALVLGRAGVKNAWWIGAAAAIGFYWGRKKMEYEFVLQTAAQLHSHAGYWYRGWLPFEWPIAWQIQFYAPVAATIAAALAFSRPRPRPDR